LAARNNAGGGNGLRSTEHPNLLHVAIDRLALLEENARLHALRAALHGRRFDLDIEQPGMAQEPTEGRHSIPTPLDDHLLHEALQIGKAARPRCGA